MAYFADLTPHTYTPTDGLDIVNIGWLDEDQPFSMGPTSEKFQAALRELCKCPIILHRGVHGCCYCRGRLQCGNGQIRLRGKTGIWYSAPTLVYHYVVEHNYCPPFEFIEAVLEPVEVATEKEGSNP